MRVGDKLVMEARDFVRLAPLGLVVVDDAGNKIGYGVDPYTGENMYYYEDCEEELRGCWHTFSNHTDYREGPEFCEGSCRPGNNGEEVTILKLPNNIVRRR